MSVVATDVVALCRSDLQELPGREEELHDANVRWQRAGPAVARIIQFDRAREYPFEHGIQQPRGQVVSPGGPLEGQSGYDSQVDAAVVPRPPVQGVEQVVSLAEPQRRTDDEALAQAVDEPVDTGIDADYG